MRGFEARTALSAAGGGSRPSTFQTETIVSSAAGSGGSGGILAISDGGKLGEQPAGVWRAAAAAGRQPAGPAIRHQ